MPGNSLIKFTGLIFVACLALLTTLDFSLRRWSNFLNLSVEVVLGLFDSLERKLLRLRFNHMEKNGR